MLLSLIDVYQSDLEAGWSTAVQPVQHAVGMTGVMLAGLTRAGKVIES